MRMILKGMQEREECEVRDEDCVVGLSGQNEEERRERKKKKRIGQRIRRTQVTVGPTTRWVFFFGCLDSSRDTTFSVQDGEAPRA